jgi:hypothetical protein
MLECLLSVPQVAAENVQKWPISAYRTAAWQPSEVNDRNRPKCDIRARAESSDNETNVVLQLRVKFILINVRVGNLYVSCKPQR